MTWPTLRLHPVSAVSPSRFCGMRQCPLREAWSAGGAQSLVPSSPRAFLGTVIHKLVETATEEAEEVLSQRFDDLTTEANLRLSDDPIQRRWVPLATHAPEYTEMRRRAIKRAQAAARQFDGRSTRGRRRAGPEVRVSARSGQIRGSIDEVDLSGGRVVLRDLKTGNVRKSGTSTPEPKPEYATQLQMYAAMYAEDREISGGRWPDSLELVPLYGASLAVPYERAECTALLDEAVQALRMVNDVIGSHDNAETLLARPSPEVCRWCPYRPACKAYRCAASVAANPAWPPDVWGLVVDRALRGNGTLAISLRQGDNLYRVRDIPRTPTIHPEIDRLELGRSLAIFGLVRARAADTFSAGPFTVIHPY
ncbi:RecB family exonuclease [Rhodococcus koreensis]|uniref:RecB family exonuclease n=1 Tax=Rhodococcus koreensis TaxID=99653 RepID=UPI0036DA3456